MQVRLTIPFTGDRRAVAAHAAAVLRVVAEINVSILRAGRGRIPALYRSGVRYELEPPGTGEHFANVLEVLRAGWGDCDDLTSWRLGELWTQGERRAGPCIVWPRETGRYHALVRRADGTQEDPSWIVRDSHRRLSR